MNGDWRFKFLTIVGLLVILITSCVEEPTPAAVEAPAEEEPAVEVVGPVAVVVREGVVILPEPVIPRESIPEHVQAVLGEALVMADDVEGVNPGEPEAPLYAPAVDLARLPIDNYLVNPAVFSTGLLFKDDTDDAFLIVVSGAEEEAVNTYIDQALLTLDVDAVFFQPQYLPLEPTLNLDEMLLDQLIAQSGGDQETIINQYNELVVQEGEENVTFELLAQSLGVEVAQIQGNVEDQAVNRYLSGPGAEVNLRALAFSPGLAYVSQPQRPADFLLLERIQEASGLTLEELSKVRADLVAKEGEENVNLDSLAAFLGFDAEELFRTAEGSALEFANREAIFQPRFAAEETLRLRPQTPLEMYIIGESLAQGNQGIEELEIQESEVAVSEVVAGSEVTAADITANALSFGFALPTADLSIEGSIDTLITMPGIPFLGDQIGQAAFSDLDYSLLLIANPADLLITFEWLTVPTEAPEEPLVAWYDIDPFINNGVTHYYRSRCQYAASATMYTLSGETELRMWRYASANLNYVTIGDVLVLQGDSQSLQHSSSPYVGKYDIKVRGHDDMSQYRIYGFWNQGYGTDC